MMRATILLLACATTVACGGWQKQPGQPMPNWPTTPRQQPMPTDIPPGTVCTMDAKQCPDGSWVGRSGPNCEFVCPAPGSGAPAQ